MDVVRASYIRNMAPEIRKWADAAVKDKRVLRIKAKDEKFRRAPYFITAKGNPETKTMEYGSEVEFEKAETDWQKRAKSIFDTAKEVFYDKEQQTQESVYIKHDMVLNLGLDRDAALFYLILIHDGIIAPSIAKYIPGHHRFYIEDKDQELQVGRDEVQLKIDMFLRIRELKPEDLPAFYRLFLDRKPGHTSNANMRAEIELFTDKNAKVVKRHLEDPRLVPKLFIQKLLNHDIIRFNKINMSYFADETRIGTSIDDVIDFLGHKDNVRLREMWAKQIREEAPEIEAKKKVKEEASA